VQNQIYFRELLMMKVIYTATQKQGRVPGQKQLVGSKGDKEGGLINEAIADLNSQERATFMKSYDSFNKSVAKLRQIGFMRRDRSYGLTEAGEEFIRSLPDDLYKWPAIIPIQNERIVLSKAIYYGE
jgi:hypothetical protein